MIFFFLEVAEFAILPLLLRVPFFFFFLVVVYFGIMSGKRASEIHPTYSDFYPLDSMYGGSEGVGRFISWNWKHLKRNSGLCGIIFFPPSIDI